MNRINIEVKYSENVKYTEAPTVQIINCKNYAACKLTKCFTLALEQNSPFSYAFSVKNKLPITKSLTELEIRDGVKVISFDITSMYTYIVTDVVISVTDIKQEIVTLK